MARRKKVDLSKFTTDYIMDRRSSLMGDSDKRNADMVRYEKMYRLDVWKAAPQEGEQRVTLTMPFDVVEKKRAMLWAKQPSISIPVSGAGQKNLIKAQQLEAFLYGVYEGLNLFEACWESEWNAQVKTFGGIKLVHDPYAIAGKLPLTRTVVEPSSVYAKHSPEGDLVELVHSWERPRREIEDEWGVTLDSEGVSEDKLDEWLDEEVCFTEYWATQTVMEVVDESEDEEEQDDTPGVIQRAAEHYMEGVIRAKAPPPQPSPVGTGEGEAEPSIGDYLEAEGVETGEPKAAKKKAEKQRVQRIINAVVVGEGDDAAFIKKAVNMSAAGYHTIPYFLWGGVTIPGKSGREYLSAYFAMSGGDAGREGMSLGVFQAQNTLISLYLDEVARRIHAPIMTDDPNVQVDTSPDAVNLVQQGRSLNYMQAPPVPAGAMQVFDVLQKASHSSGIHEVWDGQQVNLSGASIDSQTSIAELVMAQQQHQREQALRRMFEHILCLARVNADPDTGWRAYGKGKNGRYVDETVKPDDIGDEYRVRIALSSSLPKNTVALLNMMAQLVSKDMLSLWTFLDQYQKLQGAEWDSPDDEIAKIVMGKLMFNEEMMNQIAEVKGKDYVALMQGKIEGISREELERNMRLRVRPGAMPEEPPPPQVLRPPPMQGPQPGMMPGPTSPPAPLLRGEGSMPPDPRMMAMMMQQQGGMPG